MRAAPLLLLLPCVVLAATPAPPVRAPVSGGDRAAKTVAVLPFTNGCGDPQYDPLGKGIAAMMITDLSRVDGIRLVERERLNDLAKELDLQKTGVVDSTTAALVGKLVGAQYVVTGAVTPVDPNVRIDTRVIRVESGEIVKTAHVTGEQKKFFDLQQKLSKELMKGLDVVLSPEDSVRLDSIARAERIDDMAVTLKYSQALDNFDQGHYVDAVSLMTQVVHSAPHSTVMHVTYVEMEKRARASIKKQTSEKFKGWLRKKIDRDQ